MTRLKSCVIMRFQVSYACKAIDFPTVILPFVNWGMGMGRLGRLRPGSAFSVG
jgi:hypothetical protein